MTQVIEIIGGGYRNRTGLHGFAIQKNDEQIQGDYVSKEAPTNREPNGKVSNADLTTKENPGALVGATGAKYVLEVSSGRTGEDDIASITARHPIIATHWGLVA